MQSRSAAWSLLAVVCLTAAGSIGCSCSGPETRRQEPKLGVRLPPDPSGKADFLLDFGPVQVGTKAIRGLPLGNGGAAPLVVEAGQAATPFAVEQPRSVTVAVGGDGALSFSFSPDEVDLEPRDAIVELVTNEASGKRHSLRLLGQGVEQLLACDPELDFGQVVRGRTVSLPLRCTNESAVALDVTLGGFRGNFASLYGATAPGTVNDRVRVEAGAQLEIQVRFQGTSAGRNDATFVLVDDADIALATVALMAETVESALMIDPEGCLEFGYAAIDEAVRRTLRLKNVGADPLRLIRALIPETNGTFAVLSEFPSEVAPGETAELLVEFSPPVAGKHDAEIGVVFADPRGTSSAISACVTGFGGGPKLLCDREAIDFGMVAIGMPVTRSFRCMNDGAGAPGTAVDPLRLSGLVSDDPAFHASIRDPVSGSVGPKPEGYQLGEAFVVEVRYDPAAEVFQDGTLSVETEEPGGTHRVRLSGTGRDLPPCDYSIEPADLRFGVVDRGLRLTQNFAIVNHRDTACLVSDLHLAPGSDPAFSVEPIENVELAPSGKLRIPVTFAPTAYGALFTGKVRFQISSDERPAAEVALRGISERPCLIVSPDPVDFGITNPGCFTRERSLILRNVCATTSTVAALEIHETADAGAFQIARRPTFPLVLEASQEAEFSLRFGPSHLGEVAGSLAVWLAGESEPYLVRLDGEGAESDERVDTFQQPLERAAVDILWVIDNSTSMAPFQNLLAENLPAFLSYASVGDYRIAVTSTGLTPMSIGAVPCGGGANGGEGGRFFPVDGSHPRILRADTPDLEEHWRFNMKVGVCHGVERPLEAALRALTRPLIVSEKSSPNSPYDDGNVGFLREHADLSIIFVTDQMDHSFMRTPAQYLAGFRAIKGAWRSEKVKVHAITIPASWSGFPGCGFYSEERSDRIMTVVEATGGTWVNLCNAGDQQGWAAGLRKMSAGTFEQTSRFSLQGTPADRSGDLVVDEADLEVRIDGKVLDPYMDGATVWTYDYLTNAVIFERLFIPKAGAELAVDYQVACDPR